MTQQDQKQRRPLGEDSGQALQQETSMGVQKASPAVLPPLIRILRPTKTSLMRKKKIRAGPPLPKLA